MNTNDYQPVVVSGSHGFTRGRGLQALNASVESVSQDAQLDPFPLYLRELIPYDMAARMAESNQSFVHWSKHMVQQMMNSMYRRTEIEMLYGQSSLGTVDTCTNPSSGTTTVLTLTTASWAPGIWAGSENSKLKLFKTSDNTLLNSNAVIVVTAVDTANRSISVRVNNTDLVAAYNHLNGGGDAYILWSDSTTTTIGDIENPGIDKIITNTGTLFNISASTYALWKGHSYAAGGAISR